ncbi:MAG: trans-sulfuration enzyme family protein [Gaiellaceae bacterium]
MGQLGEIGGFATRAIHSGEAPDPVTHAHATPIYQTATFVFDTAEEKEAAVDAAMEWEPRTFFYTRTGNPTTSALEEKIAAIEGAESALATSSGMAAVSTTLFSLLNAGDHCIASDDIFVITRFLLDDVLANKGIEVTRLDVTDLGAVRAAIRPNTKGIFIESLSNPHMHFADVHGLAAIAHDAGIVLVVDNTFLSPAVFRPLEQGADIVLHSSTKYLSGHGDTVGGVVAGSRELIDRVRYQADALGTAPSPFNSWLTLRGVRTLPLRLKAHSANALTLARFLEERDEVEHVRYPGLESHAQHALATEQLVDGFGGMFSMRLCGGADQMNAFANATKLSGVAVSLGDLKTLVYPMPKRDNLIRVSVGCEDIEDILGDFEQALAIVPTAAGVA